MPPMIQESQIQQLIGQWVNEPGYFIASARIEVLAQTLTEFNPLFQGRDFTQLKIMDIGCGGTRDPDINSEHKFQLLRLWEPWLLRIAWMLKAKVRDGIDVVSQHVEDEDYSIYNHKVANIYTGYSAGISLADLTATKPECYNVINCTNVINPHNPSPYLENLFKSLNIHDQKDIIISRMIKYVIEYAKFALEENGVFVIDDNVFIKRNGELLRIIEQ